MQIVLHISSFVKEHISNALNLSDYPTHDKATQAALILLTQDIADPPHARHPLLRATPARSSSYLTITLPPHNRHHHEDDDCCLRVIGRWTLGMVAPLAIGLEGNKQMHQRELKYEELCGKNELAGSESWTLGMVAPLAIGLEGNKQMHQRELKYEELCGKNELAGSESWNHDDHNDNSIVSLKQMLILTFSLLKKNHKLRIFATFSRTGMCIRIYFRQQKDTIFEV
uniref:Uncharacterized protein n=1 Tax=Oryza meridionalis TaxID=40149 RepID=A0A0E0D1W4_9ORYZ